MEKIKSLKNKINFENIFIVYIILQPIIDIITSLCVRNISEELTFGIFIRAIFILYIVIYSIFKVNKKDKWKLLLYYASIGLYCIAFLANSYAKYGMAMIFTQIKGLIKTFYFPIILASLLMLFKEQKYLSKQKYLNIALWIYVLTIVICKIFSIGYPTYPFKANTGTIGLFYAGNEISAIIAIIAPICFSSFISQKFSILKAILCALTVFALLEVGTKVAFVSTIGLVLLSLIISFIKFITKGVKNFYKQFITILLITILTFLFVGNTSAGRNVGITPLFFNKKTISSNEKTHKENSDKKSQTTLLSGRNNFFKTTSKRYNQSSITDKLIGIGYIYPKKGVVQESKLIEIDYFDVFFCHGILGTLVYIAPLAILIFILLKKFFSNFIVNTKDNVLIFMIYSVLIGFGIALTAGHVFTAPAVSMFLILIILEIFTILYYEKDLKNE